MSYQGAMSHGQITANDARIHAGAGNVADGDFPGGRCLESTATDTDRITLRDKPNLAVNDEINFIFPVKAASWDPEATITIAAIADNYTPTSGTHRVELLMDNVRQMRIQITSGGSSTGGGVVVGTLGDNTYTFLRLRFKRTGASTCEAELYSWNGSSWTSYAAATTHAAWTANALVVCATGLFGTAFGKGGSAAFRHGYKIAALNEIPVVTARMYWLLPSADGGTLQWTLSTGTSHFAVLDDAYGSGGADYAESGTAAGDKRDDIVFADFPAATAASFYGLVTGIESFAQAGAAGRSDFGLRDNGADGTFFDPYNWAAGVPLGQVFYPLDAGGGAWSEADVNSVEFVVRRLAAGAGNNYRVGALGIGVLYEPAAPAAGDAILIAQS